MADTLLSSRSGTKPVSKTTLLLFLLAFVSVATSFAQSIPAVKANALDDSEVILPRPDSQQILILIVSFSRKSGKLCEVWSRRISADYEADTRVVYYSLPVLESAPSIVRPMIVYGMRKGVPPKELRHFVPIYSNESEWKKLVSFSSPHDPYLIVVRSDGQPVWQAHGLYTDALYADLQKSVAALLTKSP